MEEDVLSALRSRAVYLPGCFDRNGRVLVVVNVPSDIQQPWNKRCLDACINYIRKSLSSKSTKNGITVILDGEKYATRVTRSQCRSIGMIFEDSLAQLILIRSEGFWDKHIDHCAKNHSQGEPIVTTKSRLNKYFEMSELPSDLGGTVAYNHDRWLQNRVRIEDFRAKYCKTTCDIENLQALLHSHTTLNPTEVSQALKSCEDIYTDVQLTITRTIEMGNQLTANINDCYRVPSSTSTGTSSSIDFHKMPQDVVGDLEQITDLLNEIEKRQSAIRFAWNELEKTIHEARELLILEKGVAFVVKWMLSIADKKLNRDTRVGCDIGSCEELLRENDLLDMQCQEVYAYCTELLYKVESQSIHKESNAYKELLSKKSFMDFICRNFACRLETRRNLLSSSMRFFSMVSEYFDRTSEVFESLVMGYKAEDFDLAMTNLNKLTDCQSNLENLEKELVHEGKNLIEMLSMPIKDALGRDIGVDYNDDIANIRDILDVTMARRNIFIDSVELQKLTLEQVAHIHEYEKDAQIAIKCMDDLYSTLVRCHSHVGCTVFEIQLQKDELQTFRETGKGIHNLGCQLLEAALALRQSCKLKLETNTNNSLNTKLSQIWSNLETIIQENMTRLRVSAVFHRNVDDYCIKLLELKTNVFSIGNIEDPEIRRTRLRTCFVLRERLLLEVGRMVRLGRLLKTRLKEPFVLESIATKGIENGIDMDPNIATETVETILPAGGNSIACSAISSKILEVSDEADSLDAALNDAQTELDEHDEQKANSVDDKAEINCSSSADDLSCSIRSTEDESYATASEYNGTMRSSRCSSYHTASEHRTSPWWSGDKSSFDECSELSTETPTPTPQTSGIQSGNSSFDSSDLSFRSVQETPEVVDGVSDKNEISAGSVTPTNSDSEVINVPDKNVSVIKSSDGLGECRETGEDGPIPEVRGSKTSFSPYYENIQISKQAIKGCL